MSTIRLEFTGSVSDLQSFLSELPATIAGSLSANVLLTAQYPSVATLEARAISAASQHPESKIQAIKAVRALTGWGLREPKDFVEAKVPCFKDSVFRPNY